MAWVDGFKDWCLEQIASLKDQNKAIENGATFRQKHGDAPWVDTTQASYDANVANIERLEGFIVDIDQKGEDADRT